MLYTNVPPVRSAMATWFRLFKEEESLFKEEEIRMIIVIAMYLTSNDGELKN